MGMWRPEVRASGPAQTCLEAGIPTRAKARRWEPANPAPLRVGEDVGLSGVLSKCCGSDRAAAGGSRLLGEPESPTGRGASSSPQGRASWTWGSQAAARWWLQAGEARPGQCVRQPLASARLRGRLPASFCFFSIVDRFLKPEVTAFPQRCQVTLPGGRPFVVTQLGPHPLPHPPP